MTLLKATQEPISPLQIFLLDIGDFSLSYCDDHPRNTAGVRPLASYYLPTIVSTSGYGDLQVRAYRYAVARSLAFHLTGLNFNQDIVVL